MNSRNVITFFVILILILIGGGVVYYCLPVEKPSAENIKEDVVIQDGENNRQKDEAIEDALAEDKLEDMTYINEGIRKITENWITNNSPTYSFDGIGLTFSRLNKLNFDDCLKCYIVEYEFKSRNAGYGNRTGDMLAQVIVSHYMTLLVSNNKVTRAITDAKYDEIREEFINISI